MLKSVGFKNVKNLHNSIQMFCVVGSVLLFFFAFIFASYGDIFITSMHGIKFWYCLFDGEILNYYTYCKDSVLVSGIYGGSYTPLYDFMIYIIFAIWDFPLWIVENIFNIPSALDTLLGAMWAKSISIVFWMMCIIVISKIVSYATEEKVGFRDVSKQVVFSSLVLICVALMGQYDSIPVFFTLLGTYFLLEKKRWLFILCFSIAIPIKILVLFLFIPMLLITEKRMIKIIIELCVSFIPYILLRGMVPMNGESNIDIFSNFLFSNQISLTLTSVPIFIILFLAVCIYCFIMRIDTCDKKRETEMVVFSAMIGMGAFLISSSAFTYWYLYIVPYLYIFIIVEKDKYEINTLLNIFLQTSVVLGHYVVFIWCFSVNIVSNTIGSKIFTKGSGSYGNPMLLFQKILGEQLYGTIHPILTPVCMAIFVTMLVAYIYINNPWKKILLKNSLIQENITFMYVAQLVINIMLVGVVVLEYIL